ncbi:hypothetical protein [Kineosporia sp. NBRC 101731]|uniref:hypothetical protein n=1 Tax=Kineosporia sp. NBRC 101731 TaxID=3032199 RepID=UPI0024A1BED3|nr:hypothetical protein [Kineosporia sp. NBRC 101731]GLY29274.1 hypothetical protein Kisp02_26390 [Kineosporia sp. NBRC 101731]
MPAALSGPAPQENHLPARATYDTDSSYIAVDTSPWIFGKKVLLPAAVIRSVDMDRHSGSPIGQPFSTKSDKATCSGSPRAE